MEKSQKKLPGREEGYILSIVVYELRKMLRYRKGAIFLALFFLLKIALLVGSDIPANPDMEEEKETYFYYLDQISGPMTEETDRFMSEESVAMSSADSAVQTAYTKFYDGLISEKLLTETVTPLMERLDNRSGFNVAYQQYLYVRQAPENRSFLYTNGWDALLSHNSMDFLLVLIIFLLLAPVYCEDGKCQMDMLTVTMKRGGACLSRYKILVSVFMVTALSFSSAGIELLFCAVKYGLPNGTFPLQSLQYFGSSTKEITLVQAFLCMTGLKTLGCLWLGAMVLFGAVFFRKYAATLLVCTAVTVLPAIGLAPAALYALPGPAALLMPSGFLRGEQVSSADMTDGMEPVFREIQLKQLLILLVLAVGCSVILLLAVQMRCSSQWSRRSRRKAPALVCAVLLASTLTGCVPAEQAYQGTFNLTDAQHYETDRYCVYFDYAEDLSSFLVVEDKETGQRMRLVRDVFQESSEIAKCIFGNGDRVYYIKLTADKSETVQYVMYDQLLVQELDLTNFSEQTIFRVNLNEKNLLGDTFAAKQKDLSLFLTALGFFVNEQSVYVISSTEICRFDRLTGQKETLIEIPVISDAAYDGTYLYYLNEKSELIQYSLEEKTGYVVPDIIAKRFYLCGDTLYFLNRKEYGAVFQWNKVTYAISKLSDKTASCLMGDERFLFYCSAGSFYRIDTSSGIETPLPETEGKILAYLFPQSSRIYFPALDGADMLCLDEESLQPICP